MSAKLTDEATRPRSDCSWPQLFTSRRQLNNRSRRTENVPFIEYLITPVEEAEAGDNNEGDDDEDNGDNMDDEEDPEIDCGEYEDDDSDKDQSNVRRFMVGDENLMSRDQVDLVASFCESAGVEPDGKPSAMLDERCRGSIITEKRGLPRPYLGPLTSQQLRERLSRKVILADDAVDKPAHQVYSGSERTQKKISILR